MRITELASQVGASPDQIRYLENKGFVKSRQKLLKTRYVRDYPPTEVRKLALIARYLKQGFKIDVAFEKAMNEMSQPRLI